MTKDNSLPEMYSKQTPFGDLEPLWNWFKVL